jgi:MFS family permease
VDAIAEQPFGPVRAVAAASLTICLGMMPIFLLGAVAPFLRLELGVSAGALGLAAGVFYATSAIGSTVGGHVIERVDPIRMSRVIALAMVALGAALPFAATAWSLLLLAVALTGLVNGLTQPAANLLLRTHVESRRLDRTIGTKQAAAPFAGVMVGLLVPLSAAHVGWRWSFLLLAATALPLLLVLPQGSGRPAVDRVRVKVARGASPGLLLLSIAAGGASGTALTAAAFLVTSGVDRGLSVAAAATLLTTLSIINIATLLLSVRLSAAAGGRADLAMIATMLGAAAVGYGVVANSTGVVPFVVGALLVIAFGWGWHALMHVAIVAGRFGPPGVATGAAMTGVFGGSSIVPVVFGALLNGIGPRSAWTLLMCIAVASAASFATLARWSSAGLLGASDGPGIRR